MASALIDLQRAFVLFEPSKLLGALFRNRSSHTKHYKWPKIQSKSIQRIMGNQEKGFGVHSAQPQYVDGGWWLHKQLF